MFVPFSPPRIDDKIIAEVTAALQSGWITTGPRTKLFEKRIAEYCGVSNVLCVNSASAGLELMLRWFGVTEGDEVIIPAYTYTATANVVVHCGATPVMVDVCDDFDINVNLVRNAITPKTKVIIPVDIAGYPCNYDELNALVQDIDIQRLFTPNHPNQQLLGRILLLSDAAHSIGAMYKNRRTGSLCDLSVFSFHAVKNLTTAEGGAICLNLPKPFDNDAIYKELCVKSLHGQNKDALAKTQIGNWKYDVIEAGYKCNMTDICAAMGLIELERYDQDMLLKRKYIFQRYADALGHLPAFEIPPYCNDTKCSSYHVFLLRINSITEEQRDKIIQEIFACDVAVNVHFIPLPLLSYYKNRSYKMSDFPNAYRLYASEISLPVYYDLTDQQIDAVISAVKNAVHKII